MAQTYTPLATTTLGSAASSITFSSIPSTYTDLRLILTEINSSTGNACNMTFNSDTATNYSRTWLYGDGTNIVSSRQTSDTKINLRQGFTVSTTIPNLMIVDIFSYAGSTYKTCLVSTSSDQNGSGVVESEVGLWRSTSAISTITLTPSTQFAAGTTATLYGIKAA